MTDEAPDEVPPFIPKIIGANIGVSIFEGDLDPVVVLSFKPAEGDVIAIAIEPQHLENLIPGIVAAGIRARTIAEMISIYPDKRDEIIANVMFRWTDTIVEESDGT